MLIGNGGGHRITIVSWRGILSGWNLSEHRQQLRRIIPSSGNRIGPTVFPPVGGVRGIFEHLVREGTGCYEARVQTS
jgi:hypothetical protein